ncbi:MAG: HIT family protein, partial [Cyclobacteriaceae bacterium]|nr:HIT family protein [Cyclobacteriaceae bacterium]MCK5468202.1 HIT family protein [Cyclobacteriaceae bacterium]
MSSIFTKIIERQIPAHIVAEDSENIAFLDINPLSTGHTLVIPKKEVDYLFDLEDEIYTSLNLFAKKVAIAIKKVTGKRIGTAVIGIEVPHAHIHLIPFIQMSELNFANPKLRLSSEE